MSKSSDLAQSSARGGLNILWGMILSSVISAVGTIIVGNALGDDFALIAIVLSGPLMITSIRDLGINQAIVKYATQYRTENKSERLKSVVIVGTTFSVILGLLFTIASFLLSGVMANVLERPTIVPLIQIASVIILADGLLKLVQAVFLGYEKMALHSLTQVAQSVLKTTLMVFLVVMSFGAHGAIIGQIVAYCATGLVSFTLLYFVIIAKLRKQEYHFNFISTIKTMLTFGLPLSIASMLSGILPQFYVFITAIYTNDLIMSDYTMANYFAALVSIFATSVTTVMFPTFSKIQGQKDPQTLRSVFRYSVKYTSLLIVPLTFAIISLSTPGVESLFADEFEYTSIFLSLNVLTFLYSAIGHLSVGPLLSSQGKTQFNMKMAMLTFIIAVGLSLVLVPSFQVFGLLVAHVISGLPALLVSLWWVNKNFEATVDLVSSVKILVISAFSAALTFFVINQLQLTSWVGLLIGAPVFLGTYVVAAPIVGAITYDDTKILKSAVKSLGPLALVFDVLLYPVEKIAKGKQKNSNN